MNTFKSLLGGLAGAVTLNLFHEGCKYLINGAPRVDLLGEEALSRTITEIGMEPLKGDDLYLAALAGDVVGNTMYYSLIGSGKKKYLLLRGLGYGLAAGLGTTTLSKPLGLNEDFVNRNKKTTLLTLAYYTIGGLAAAYVMRILSKKAV